MFTDTTPETYVNVTREGTLKFVSPQGERHIEEDYSDMSAAHVIHTLKSNGIRVTARGAWAPHRQRGWVMPVSALIAA